MREAVICEPVRTPVGRFGGMFRNTPVTKLAATVVAGLVARTGLTSDRCRRRHLRPGLPERGGAAIGRVAALDAGLDVGCPASRSTGAAGPGCRRSSTPACRSRRAGRDLVLAGGAESMSQAELYSPTDALGHQGGGVQLHDRLARGRASPPAARNYPVPGGMIETAENLRREYGIPPRASRTSSRCAPTSAPSPRSETGRSPTRSSRSASPTRKGEQPSSTVDEHPRPDTTVEKLGRAAADPGPHGPRGDRHGGQRQRPERRRRGVHRDHPEQGGRARACARWPGWSAGRSPACRRGRWASGRSRPTAKALERGRPRRSPTCDLIELNEAFAAQVLAVHARVGASPRPTSSGSTSTAPASRSATRSAPPAVASWPRCCARWTGARPGTGWRRCASAAGRGSRRCSNGSRHERTDGRGHRGRGFLGSHVVELLSAAGRFEVIATDGDGPLALAGRPAVQAVAAVEHEDLERGDADAPRRAYGISSMCWALIGARWNA